MSAQVDPRKIHLKRAVVNTGDQLYEIHKNSLTVISTSFKMIILNKNIFCKIIFFQHKMGLPLCTCLH